ncbi:MAG: adenylate/guanylate cyclase domain-containing protein [Armatimonadetes bacterium]|nr:adenylate/guanylate cyclase domain-containing protein [Armatimonadota bacterium]
MGDAFQEVLEAHHAVLRREFRRHGSEEVREAGDSFVVPFASATDAVECAVSCQRALAAHPWPREVGTLRVRMALYTGDVRPAEGDYHEVVLHRASRLLSAAHGGQILGSEATATLLKRDLREGIELADLGIHRLRDAPMPERLFQVNYPDMAVREFPPLRAEAGYAGNLPLQLTRFFGRGGELEELQALLTEEGQRLVTLTGPGGSGKTRLALETARRLMDWFGGAVWFVPLADLRDAHLIPGAVADAIGLPRSPQVGPLDQLAMVLGEQTPLLILDNMEQVLPEGGPVILSLLDRIRSATCLATSRQRLDLPGERLYSVPPLPIPEADTGPEALSECPSVRLLVDRAQSAKPDFQLTQGNASAIATLCERLEGIPLAIELAAARAQVLTPSQMVAQLDQRFDFLVSRRRVTEDRHKTLRAAIEWSCDLLYPELRRFFYQLSVFRGGWTLEAAEAVCEEARALECLQWLCGASLIHAEETGLGMRFRMLETVREFGKEQLPAGELADLRQRHAEWFSQLAEEAEAELEGPDLAKWIRTLREDHDNLRAALEWALGGRTEMALRTAAALWRFWETTGSLAEGRHWLERGLAQPDRVPAGLRVTALAAAAALAFGQGDGPGLAELAGECLTASRELGEQSGTARALTLLALEALDRGECERATGLAEESLALYRCTGHQRGTILALFALGGALMTQRRHAEAATALEEAVAPSRQVRDPARIASALKQLAEIRLAQGAPREAEAMLGESLSLARDLQASDLTAVALLNQAGVALSLRDYARARVLAQEALTTGHAAGAKVLCAYCLETLGLALAGLKEWGRAARLWGAARSQRQALSLPPGDRPDEVMPGARRAIGGKAFEAALVEGQAMTLDEAIRYALRDEDEALPARPEARAG